MFGTTRTVHAVRFHRARKSRHFALCTPVSPTPIRYLPKPYRRHMNYYGTIHAQTCLSESATVRTHHGEREHGHLQSRHTHDQPGLQHSRTEFSHTVTIAMLDTILLHPAS